MLNVYLEEDCLVINNLKDNEFNVYETVNLVYLIKSRIKNINY